MSGSSPRIKDVVAITGSRAEFGLMRPVFRAISAHTDLSLRLVVTGSHLIEGASSLEEIRREGFQFSTVQMLGDMASSSYVAQGIGRAVMGFAELFETEQPDAVLLQGDRGEMLSAAIAAAHLMIPIFHMSGGDVSGTIDDPVRNAISDFAHIHLTSCTESADRLRARGEQVTRIFEVGEPAIDVLSSMAFQNKADVLHSLGLPGGCDYLLVTLHPEGQSVEDDVSNMIVLLRALQRCGLPCVVTHPNSDRGGAEMKAVLNSINSEQFFVFSSLGHERYLNALRHCVAVVGNSSSGLIETSWLNTPCINLGARQLRRTRGKNVIDAGFHEIDILKAIEAARIYNESGKRPAPEACPYGIGNTSTQVARIIAVTQVTPALVSKWHSYPGRA